MAELILGGSRTKTRKRQTITWWQNVTSWKDPGYIEQLSLHMLRRELNYFATQELLGCSWGAHHVLDTCILLDTLKLLVEAAFWFWRCPTQESNQSKRKFLEENISWQSLYNGMIQTGFRTCMAPAFSHGYAGLLVFLLHTLPLHNTRSNQKTAETDSLLRT